MEIPGDERPIAKRRLILVGVLMALGFGIDGLAALLRPGDVGWMWASGATLATNFAVLGYLGLYRDPLIARLYVLGLVIGFGELATDAWAVSTSQILVYNPNGPHLWDSPLYMPFGWASTLVQLGYLGYWLAGRWKLWGSSLAIAAFGGLSLPAYETLAFYAGFWRYRDCWMILRVTPLFLIPAEAVIAAVIPSLAIWASRVTWPRIFVLGLFMAAFIYVISPIFFALLGQQPA